MTLAKTAKGAKEEEQEEYFPGFSLTDSFSGLGVLGDLGEKIFFCLLFNPQ